MKVSAQHLAALSRLFSSSVYRELARKGRSSLFARLAAEAGLDDGKGDATVADAFDAAFRLLKVQGRRDEYIYRAALTHKILLGKHNLSTASMLNEFRAGSCKADLVILNGTATVYEIKSERDSLARLAHQVDNYRRVFATVNVIASEGHIDAVIVTVPNEVGVLCLSSRYRISTVREAVSRPQAICPATAFESLRSSEAAAVLKALGVQSPSVPNTQRRTTLKELFIRQDPAHLHSQMVTTLKKSRNLAPLNHVVERLPKSLHAAALSIPVRLGDHERVARAVAVPLRAAMAWE